MKNETQVVIIGAGLTGLTLAYYLKRQGMVPLVIEKEERPGGVIRTYREQGFVYEAGPNTGVLGNLEVMQLFADLGDRCGLEVANPQAKRRLIWKDGRWHHLPSGLKEAIQTPLFTMGDKLRILGEPFRGKGSDPDESVGDLVKRRMGKSFLDYAVDPFISGIYAGDPDLLVTRYALPKLYRLEQTYGSFIGGAIKKKVSEKGPAPTREVFSVKGGLENLVNALVREIGPENIRCNSRISLVEPVADESHQQPTDLEHGRQEQAGAPGSSKSETPEADRQLQTNVPPGGYRLHVTTDGADYRIHVPLVISTVGAHALTSLFPFIASGQAKIIGSLAYARVVQVVLGFKNWEGLNLKAFGGLVPSRENRRILGVLFPSAFLHGRAPQGGALLNVFLGGIRRPAYYDMSDEDIMRITEEELSEMLCLPTWKPDLAKVFRYRHAIPQYTAEAGGRIDTIRQVQQQYPGLILAGNIHEGIGMADRVAQAMRIAKEVADI